VSFIRRAAENAAAKTNDIKKQGYIKEIADTIAEAVAATNQTFADALKNTSDFTEEKWAEAAQKSLTARLASISPAAKAFIETAYGDINTYLKNKIEAEVRKQKNEVPATLALPALESSTDTTAVAASTAAATAATIAQDAIKQISPESPVPEPTI